MQVFIKVASLQKRLRFIKDKNRSIGFVPTMGALHAGHISLMKESVLNNDITVCSIFVNPTQFNNKEDLLKYPRTKEEDTIKLINAGVDILFYPDESEIYPDGEDSETVIDLIGLDRLWEGEFRPGHFAGVIQVVKRLLDIVKPTNLYMGQKDLQQFTIVDYMLKSIDSPVKLRVIPTTREADGLAMSSRNVRLTPEHRANAVILSRMLYYAKENFGRLNNSEIENHAIEEIKKRKLNPEYFKIISTENLKEIDNNSTCRVAAIVAAWAGDVRLIDNMPLN